MVQYTHHHGRIHPEMTILEVVSTFRGLDLVFKEKYDPKIGVCICCEHLFESIAAVADRYHLDLSVLLSELEDEARQPAAGKDPCLCS
jgi:hypothetical protein